MALPDYGAQLIATSRKEPSRSQSQSQSRSQSQSPSQSPPALGACTKGPTSPTLDAPSMRSLLAALLLASSLPSRADSVADEADFRFHRGSTLIRQGNVEAALSDFLDSNRLVRNHNALFNIARCFELL